MARKLSYHEQKEACETIKLRNVLKTLPNFSYNYFRAMENTTTIKKRMNLL